MGKTKSKLYLTKSERYKIQESEKKKKTIRDLPMGGTQEEGLEETLENIMERQTDADQGQNKLTNT